jgi:hypothetical protein
VNRRRRDALVAVNLRVEPRDKALVVRLSWSRYGTQTEAWVRGLRLLDAVNDFLDDDGYLRLVDREGKVRRVKFL